MTEATNELVLIDLSSIAYPIWHMSQSEPDPNRASQQIVARVRALATGHQRVAICCDSGRSFRHDVSPTYKANRPEHEAPLEHQIALAREALAGDGFPVWSVKGFEADDLIASATTKALQTPEATVLIVSADKDLLQLVGPRVVAISVRDGSRVDAEAVATKFGVIPEQMRDYLTMVGDTSDNVKGVKGIGPKRAAELLAKFRTLDALYEELQAVGAAAIGLTPAIASALHEFKPELDTTRKLLSLRTDVELPFEAWFGERTPQPAPPMDFAEDDTEEPPAAPAPLQAVPPPVATPVLVSASDPHQAPTAALPAPSPAPTEPASTALAVREPDLAPAPAEWERQLDPRTMRDARLLAKDMYDSRMFSAYGTPQAVLSTVMVGRELGLPAMASLRCIHNIEGKHSLSASLMVAIVLRSGLAEYFEPISFSETEATYETKRKGARNPIRLTHTFDMGKQAWPKEKTDWEKRFQSSGWGRNPTDMLCARASARLARMIYPDLLAGLYTPEELAEIRETVAA
jgi:5'-3' exonuclease